MRVEKGQSGNTPQCPQCAHHIEKPAGMNAHGARPCETGDGVRARDEQEKGCDDEATEDGRCD